MSHKLADEGIELPIEKLTKWRKRERYERSELGHAITFEE